MLGGAFSSFMGQIACSVHAVWLFVREGFARNRSQL
ncbi:unknown [Eggerthella sp. CAG:298]|nr:unknown [Eggerthella sp. CAG:298]